MTTTEWPVRELVWTIVSVPGDSPLEPAVAEWYQERAVAEVRGKVGDTARIVAGPRFEEHRDEMTWKWSHAVFLRVAWDHDTYGDPWPIRDFILDDDDDDEDE